MPTHTHTTVHRLATLLVVVMAGLWAALPATAADNALPNGDFADDLKGWTVAKQHPFEATVVDAQDIEAKHALSITVDTKPAQNWHVQVRHALSQPLQANQQGTVTAWMRSPDELPISIMLQQASPPFTPLMFERFTLTPQWKQYTFEGVSRGPADKAQLTLTAGFETGRVEVADIRVALGEVKTAPAVPADQLEPVDLTGIDLPGLAEALGDDPRSIVQGLDRLKIGSTAGQADITTDPTSGRTIARLATLEPTEWTYKVQALSPTLTPIQQGDTLLAIVRWRVAEVNPLLGYASLGVIFEMAGPPHEKDMTRLLTASGTDWHLEAIPFTATQDYAPRRANFSLRVGYGVQAVEVSHMALVNLGPGVAVADAPQTRASYGGSEPDAPWRADALQRIEKHRKGDLSVQVVDAQGQPIPDAQVHVQMTRHAFGFGTAINANRLPGGRAADDAGPYLEKAAELFNWAVFENAMKWKVTDNAYYQRQVQTGLKWMKEQGMTVRGHTLVWPSFKRCPPELASLADQPEALSKAIDEHITEVASRYAGQLVAWDTINEPFKNRDLMDILGDDQLARWLKIAHEADPHAAMFINDFQILSDPSPNPVRAQYYLGLIDTLRSQGAPLDGIGMQSHFSGELTPIEQIIARLDAFADKGMRIHITEMDIATNDEQLQADYARDFLTACYSHPAVECVLVWGFWEGQMFQSDGALYRKDWSIKPVGEAFRDLILKTWHTDETLTTDAKGLATTRGFVGDYDVTVTVDGQTTTRQTTLSPDGQTVRIAF